MKIDHLVIKSYKGVIHETVNNSKLIYLPDFYVEINAKKESCIYITSSNRKINSSIGKHVHILPKDIEREKKILKHFTDIEKKYVDVTLILPKEVLDILSMFYHKYTIKVGDWGVDIKRYMLRNNIVHITGMPGSGKTTLYKKLKKTIECYDLDDINKKTSWKRDANKKLIDEYVKSGRPIIFLGMTSSYVKMIAGQKFILTVDSETNYRRVLLRIFNDIEKNQTKIKDIITNDKIDSISTKCVRDYGVTQLIVPTFSSYKNLINAHHCGWKVDGYNAISPEDAYNTFCKGVDEDFYGIKGIKLIGDISDARETIYLVKKNKTKMILKMDKEKPLIDRYNQQLEFNKIAKKYPDKFTILKEHEIYKNYYWFLIGFVPQGNLSDIKDKVFFNPILFKDFLLQIFKIIDIMKFENYFHNNFSRNNIIYERVGSKYKWRLMNDVSPTIDNGITNNTLLFLLPTVMQWPINNFLLNQKKPDDFNKILVNRPEYLLTAKKYKSTDHYIISKIMKLEYPKIYLKCAGINNKIIDENVKKYTLPCYKLIEMKLLSVC
jgi:hypothetical protein